MLRESTPAVYASFGRSGLDQDSKPPRCSRRRWRLVQAQLALAALWLCACTEPVHHTTAEGANAAAAAFGSGATELGVELVDEGRSEGPRSLAISDDGRQVFVLDPVNRRIASFDNGTLFSCSSVKCTPTCKEGPAPPASPMPAPAGANGSP